MNLDDFFAQCEAHLEHAKNSHPMFVETIDNNAIRRANYGNFAKIAEFDCEHSIKTSLHDVLIEEVYEFLYEVSKGHLHRAKEEAADIVAVLFRAIDEWMEGDEEEEEDPRAYWNDMETDRIVEQDQMRRAGEMDK